MDRSSILRASTTLFRACLRQALFRKKRYDLRAALMARLALQASWTCEARREVLLGKAVQNASARTHSLELNMSLACLLTLSVLIRAAFAVLANVGALLTPFWAFLPKLASLLER